MNAKQIETYKPLLDEFCQETKKFKNKIEMPGLFLPHGLENYETAKNKFFYVGRDTAGWIPFNELIDCFENNKIIDYINKNDWPNSLDEVFKQANNNPSSFWNIACRLQLKLNGVKEDLAINTNLSDEYKQILLEMGYGNLNSIETPQSIKNRKEWDSIDKNIYKEIKNKSLKFDNLKFILDIYNPSHIFIFNLKGDEELAFKNLEYECIQDKEFQNLIAIYTITGYKTKIIWTVHPGSFRYIKKNALEKISVSEWIDEIINRT
jgi:hypothetical protein